MSVVSLETRWLDAPASTRSQMLAYVRQDPRPMHYSDAMLERIADAFIHWSTIFPIGLAPVWGQVMHETDRFRFTGDVLAEQFNFAGLGATGGVRGATFNSPEDGALCVFVHHMAYIFGTPDHWPADLLQYRAIDVRNVAVIADARLGGQVTTIGDYVNGRWAETQSLPFGTLANGYARGIVRNANAILALPAGDVPAPPAMPDTGGHMAYREPTSADLGVQVDVLLADASVTGAYTSQWFPDLRTAEMDAARLRLEIDWYVVHYTVGHWPTDRDYLRGGHDASARAVISPTGAIAILVPLNVIAWAAGSLLYNARGVNYELSSFDGTYADVQYASLAAIMAWDYQQIVAAGYAAPALTYIGKTGQRGMIGHQDIPNPKPVDPDPNKYCGPFGGAGCHGDPGSRWDWPRFTSAVNARIGQTPPADPYRHFAEVPYFLGGGFKGYWEALEQVNLQGVGLAWDALGFPRSNEFQANVGGAARTVQVFDRGATVWEPEAPAGYDIHHVTGFQFVAVALQGYDAGVVDAGYFEQDATFQQILAWRTAQTIGGVKANLTADTTALDAALAGVAAQAAAVTPPAAAPAPPKPRTRNPTRNV